MKTMCSHALKIRTVSPLNPTFQRLGKVILSENSRLRYVLDISDSGAQGYCHMLSSHLSGSLHTAFPEMDVSVVSVNKEYVYPESPLVHSYIQLHDKRSGQRIIVDPTFRQIDEQTDIIIGYTNDIKQNLGDKVYNACYGGIPKHTSVDIDDETPKKMGRLHTILKTIELSDSWIGAFVQHKDLMDIAKEYRGALSPYGNAEPFDLAFTVKNMAKRTQELAKKLAPELQGTAHEVLSQANHQASTKPSFVEKVSAKPCENNVSAFSK